MRNCTWGEIERILRKYPDAKQIAVQNFLATVGNCETPGYTRANLKKDARLYHWNVQTLLAIRAGINLVSKTW